MMIIRLCLMCFLVVLSGVALAEGDSTVYVSDVAARDAKALHERIQAITDDLSDTDKRHFFTIYEVHNLIETVETVRGHVEKGVSSCVKANPDIAEGIEAQYDALQGALDPVLGEAGAQLQNLIIAQDYIKPKTITKLLKRTDKVRAKTSNSLDKVYVSDLKSCKRLQKTMKKTQGKLVRMLEKAVIDIPRSLGAAAAE